MHTLELKVDPLWKIIGDVKSKISLAMQDNGIKGGLFEFTNIVASELLENAIKYGIENPERSKIGFEFEIHEEFIQVKVKNGIESKDSIKDFIHIMERIKTSTDMSHLYIERLKEIIEHPDTEKSRLGLYRIVSECGFTLDYTISDSVLEVIAVRKLQGVNS